MNLKHEDGDEVDDDGTATKDSDSTKLTISDNKDVLLDPERLSSSGKDCTKLVYNNNNTTITTTTIFAEGGKIGAAAGEGVIVCGSEIANGKNCTGSSSNINETNALLSEQESTSSGVMIKKPQEAIYNVVENKNTQEQSIDNKEKDVFKIKVDDGQNNDEVPATSSRHTHTICGEEDTDTVSNSIVAATTSATGPLDVSNHLRTTKQSTGTDMANSGATSNIGHDTPKLVDIGGGSDDICTGTSTKSITNSHLTSSTTTETSTSTTDNLSITSFDTLLLPSSTSSFLSSSSSSITITCASSSSTASNLKRTITSAYTEILNDSPVNNTNNNINTCLGLDEEESAIGSYLPTQAPTDEISAATAWPSMQDLNTRLRRVITAYQRNCKKEELKQQQKAKVSNNIVTL